MTLTYGNMITYLCLDGINRKAIVVKVPGEEGEETEFEAMLPNGVTVSFDPRDPKDAERVWDMRSNAFLD